MLFKSGCYDQHNAMKARFAILVCIFSSLVAMTLKHNEVCNAFPQEVLNNQKRDQIVVSWFRKFFSLNFINKAKRGTSLTT